MPETDHSRSVPGNLRLSSLLVLLCWLFLRKKSFYIFLCPNQFLHLIPCLAVVRVGGFLLGQQFCELRIQRLDLRHLLQKSFKIPRLLRKDCVDDSAQTVTVALLGRVSRALLQHSRSQPLFQHIVQLIQI